MSKGNTKDLNEDLDNTMHQYGSDDDLIDDMLNDQNVLSENNESTTEYETDTNKETVDNFSSEKNLFEHEKNEISFFDEKKKKLAIAVGGFLVVIAGALAYDSMNENNKEKISTIDNSISLTKVSEITNEELESNETTMPEINLGIKEISSSHEKDTIPNKIKITDVNSDTINTLPEQKKESIANINDLKITEASDDLYVDINEDILNIDIDMGLENNTNALMNKSNTNNDSKVFSDIETKVGIEVKKTNNSIEISSDNKSLDNIETAILSKALSEAISIDKESINENKSELIENNTDNLVLDSSVNRQLSESKNTDDNFRNNEVMNTDTQPQFYEVIDTKSVPETELKTDNEAKLTLESVEEEVVISNTNKESIELLRVKFEGLFDKFDKLEKLIVANEEEKSTKSEKEPAKSMINETPIEENKEEKVITKTVMPDFRKGKNRLHDFKIINKTIDGSMSVVTTPSGRVNVYFKGETFSVRGIGKLKVLSIEEGGDLILVNKNYFIDTTLAKKPETKKAKKPTKVKEIIKTKNDIIKGWSLHGDMGDGSYIVQTPDGDWITVQKNKAIEGIGIVKGINKDGNLVVDNKIILVTSY